MALFFPTDGVPYPVAPRDPAAGFTLEQCYEGIGCTMIEVVRLTDDPHRGGIILIIDEEGKLKGDYQVNLLATVIAHALRAITEDDVIVGNVICCFSDELK